MGAAGASLPSGGEQGRGRLRRARGRRGPAERLQRLGLEVRGFVEAAGPLPGGAPPTAASKSRRELRRDRRRLKRGRRRLLLSGHGEAQAARRPQKPREEEEERPATKAPEGRRPPAPAPSRPPPPASAASSARKRALLAANEAEEREIRRLERRLGLSRRRKRRQAAGRGEAALPQSFLRDGLGYVLEALQPQDAPSGLCHSSSCSEEEEQGRTCDEARRKRGAPGCQEEEESEEEEQGWGDEVRRKRGGGTPEEEEEGRTSGGARRKRGAPGCQEEEESEEEEQGWGDEVRRKRGGGTPEEGRTSGGARRKRGAPQCQEEEESEEEEQGWGDEVRRKRGAPECQEEEETEEEGWGDEVRRKRGAPGCQEEEESEEEGWGDEVRRKRGAPECQEEEEGWRDEAKRKRGGGTPEEGRTNDEARGRRTGECQEQQSLEGDETEEEESEEDDGDSSSLEEDQGEESPMEEEVAADEREGPCLGFRSPDAGAPESRPPTQKDISHSATKYVPPQMRKTEETIDARKKELLERLKKTLKGLLNRLSEPNLASISGQLEDLYMANSRKDMNETLTEVLLSACVTETAMPSRLVMEHVLLISILHRTVGIEVGAHFLETVVKKFDEVYRSEAEGKECENLLNLIAHLYNFYVVHSLLIFDILKKLVSSFSEKDIELMLLLLKNVGFSLRKDDALALKEVITEAQKKANAVGKQFQDQSRVCFMLEIMLALKNNDMRKIPGYDPEPVEKLRKLQRTLICNSGSGKDSQLRVSLDSLLSAEQVGRWWIVGSSWSGTPMIDSASHKIQQGKVSSKILELARKQRMNTDIRRNIFCILMTSEDFLDAFEKLLKLRLKDQQEREIVHVLVDCCLQEKTYNPFYAYLSAKFCEYERRFQMTFQFSMWDKFRDLGSLSTTAFSNLVNLLAHLLKTKSLSLTVFKVIEFSELDKPKVHLLRRVLAALLLTTDPEDLNHIFGRLADNPKLGMLHEGLKLFLTHFLLKNIQAHKSTEEAALLKERIELVNRTLKAKESRLKL